MSYNDFESNSEFVDKDMVCNDCGDGFVFTARDQEFFKNNNYTPPKRCKPCVAKKKAAIAARENGGDRSGRERY